MKKTPVYYLFLFLLFLSAKGMGQGSDGKPLHIFSYNILDGLDRQQDTLRRERFVR